MIEGVLAECLSRQRDRFNSRFLAAEADKPQLNREQFVTALHEVAGPVMAEMAGIGEEQQDRIAGSLYSGLLALVANKAFNRHEGLSANLYRILSAAGHLLPAAPNRTVASLFNAMWQIYEYGPRRVGHWVEDFSTLMRHVRTLDELRLVGVVLAWMNGMAQFRPAGLAALHNLDTGLAGSLLNCSAGEVDIAIERLSLERWPRNNVPEHVATVGGFSGLNGPFESLPALCTRQSAVAIVAGDAAWHLHADRFGSFLEPLRSAAGFKPAMKRPDTKVCSALAGVDGLRGCVEGPGYTAIVSDLSYQVFIVTEGA